MALGWWAASESKQANLHQDIYTLWTLLFGLLQANWNCQQCWKPRGSSLWWPHWKLSICCEYFYGLHFFFFSFQFGTCLSCHIFVWFKIDLCMCLSFKWEKTSCATIVCTKKLDSKSAKKFKDKIDDEYHGENTLVKLIVKMTIILYTRFHISLHDARRTIGHAYSDSTQDMNGLWITQKY